MRYGKMLGFVCSRGLVCVLGGFSVWMGACSSSSGSADGELLPPDGSVSDAAQPEAQSESDAGPESSISQPDSGCQAQGEKDEPDDEYIDSNCDGIDGDASRAIFVAPGGDDQASGGKDRPVASLGKAIELALREQKAVYVCNASYSETIKLEEHGVSIYGGYDCLNGWTRSPDGNAQIAAPSGMALEVRNVAEPIRLERIVLEAMDAIELGQSSTAALVIASPKVEFRHCRFVAGEGADGTGGARALPIIRKRVRGRTASRLLPRRCVHEKGAQRGVIARCWGAIIPVRGQRIAIQEDAGETEANGPSVFQRSRVSQERPKARLAARLLTLALMAHKASQALLANPLVRASVLSIPVATIPFRCWGALAEWAVPVSLEAVEAGASAALRGSFPMRAKAVGVDKGALAAKEGLRAGVEAGAEPRLDSFLSIVQTSGYFGANSSLPKGDAGDREAPAASVSLAVGAEMGEPGRYRALAFRVLREMAAPAAPAVLAERVVLAGADPQ